MKYKVHGYLEPIEEKSKMGRPRKNKVYATLRTQKNNINRLNAIQHAKGFYSQDDALSALISEYVNNMNNEEKQMFDMYLKGYEKRDLNNQN